MKWVVRFETDGYFEGDPGNVGSTIVGVSQPLPEMSATMKGLSLEPDSTCRTLEGVTDFQRGI